MSDFYSPLGHYSVESGKGPINVTALRRDLSGEWEKTKALHQDQRSRGHDWVS